MTLTDIAASVTGEGLLAKYTGSGEHPSRDEIARLAYHFYEKRGWRHGHDIDDWLSAEQELRHHYHWTTGESPFMSALVAVHESRADHGR